jgi:AAA domain
MNEELKLQIIAATVDYAKEKKLSNNEVARLADINPGYISSMFRNMFEVNTAGKLVEISDKWFFKLAEFAGLPIKKQYWNTLQTVQFVGVISALEAAKKTSRISVVICETGQGKTYSVEKFVHANPQHTYKVTVSDAHKLRDILDELLDQLNLEHKYGTAAQLRSISDKMKELKHSGARPIIIIDEAENLKLPVIKSLKALYDIINGYASLCLIGTSQLIKRLEYMKKKDRSGVPQFYRRIKACIRYISSTPDFTPFFEKHSIEKNLRRLLCELCENYGELHDYLEPALREADEQEVPLTENLFRIIYNMPKYN